MDVDMDDRRITWRTDMDVESTATELACRIRRQPLLGGLKIRERSWEDRITRDHH